jgi:glycosyltransferase involved in cell wall biosynthesis
MIVKDEEKDIERCLKSVHKYIDYWVIIDTGSKDKTIKKIKSLMKNRFKVPGELHERPWVDFSHNRNEALEIAETKADFVMFMDADDVFKTDPGFNLDFLSSDHLCYNCAFSVRNTSFERTLMVKSNEGWKYKGVLHEYIVKISPDEDLKFIGFAENCRMFASASPLKRFNSEKEKYLNDALILEQEMIKDPDNTRNQFYLAQCYADAGLTDLAIDNYEKRIQMGGWDQEIYISLFRRAGHIINNGCSEERAIHEMSRAWEYMPYRYEAAAALMSMLVSNGRASLAFSYGEMTIMFQKVFGAGTSFHVSDLCKNYSFPRNYAVAAEKCGFYETALSALRLLRQTGGEHIKPKELDKKIKELESKCSA